MNNLDYIADSNSILGEGCVYNHSEQKLYWVDIKAKKIYYYSLIEKITTSTTFNKTISSIVFDTENNILGTTEDGFEHIDLEQGTTRIIANPEQDKINNRFNDGKCDKYGRYFAGTMDNNEETINGSLYVLEDNNVTIKETGLFVSNGLGWNNDSTKFYLTDSPKGLIYQYDYDIKNATLSNKDIFVKVDKKDGFPDGLTIDSQNYIWSAHWDGSKVTRYSPSGDIDLVVELPVPRVTCCCFGGVDNTTLFITTAKYGLNFKQLNRAPLSGCTFMLSTKTVGQKLNLFKG